MIEARGRNIPQVNCKDLKFSQAQIDRVANGSEGTDYLSLQTVDKTLLANKLEAFFLLRSSKVYTLPIISTSKTLISPSGLSFLLVFSDSCRQM